MAWRSTSGVPFATGATGPSPPPVDGRRSCWPRVAGPPAVWSPESTQQTCSPRHPATRSTRCSPDSSPRCRATRGRSRRDPGEPRAIGDRRRTVDASANRQQRLAARPLQRGRRGSHSQTPLLSFPKGVWGAASRAGGCGEPRATLPSKLHVPEPAAGRSPSGSLVRASSEARVPPRPDNRRCAARFPTWRRAARPPSAPVLPPRSAAPQSPRSDARCRDQEQRSAATRSG